jgi:hypothetical protein
MRCIARGEAQNAAHASRSGDGAGADNWRLFVGKCASCLPANFAGYCCKQARFCATMFRQFGLELTRPR